MCVGGVLNEGLKITDLWGRCLREMCSSISYIRKEEPCWSNGEGTGRKHNSWAERADGLSPLGRAPAH